MLSMLSLEIYLEKQHSGTLNRKSMTEWQKQTVAESLGMRKRRE